MSDLNTESLQNLRIVNVELGGGKWVKSEEHEGGTYIQETDYPLDTPIKLVRDIFQISSNGLVTHERKIFLGDKLIRTDHSRFVGTDGAISEVSHPDNIPFFEFRYRGFFASDMPPPGYTSK